MNLFMGRADLQRAAAYLFYRKETSGMKALFELKYHHNPEIGVWMGRLMGRKMQESNFFDGIDCLVPVPLAPKKYRARGYNQCEKLAMGVSQLTGIPIDKRSLVRSKANPTQTKLRRLERWENAQGLFQLTTNEHLAGKHLLLIDDVVTTGATLLSCIEVLREIPDVRISVLTFAVTEH